MASRAMVSIREAAWNSRFAVSVSPWRRLLNAMLRVALACIIQSIWVNIWTPWKSGGEKHKKWTLRNTSPYFVQNDLVKYILLIFKTGIHDLECS